MRGFTLIEVVVTIGISLVLVGSIIVNYNGYNDAQTLKQAALTLKNNIRYAQSKALTGEKPTTVCTQLLGYVITFTGTGYTIRASCEPEGLADAALSVTFPTASPLAFNPVPDSFTFYTVGRGTSLNTSQSLIITGFDSAYALQVSPGGDVTDLGVQ